MRMRGNPAKTGLTNLARLSLTLFTAGTSPRWKFSFSPFHYSAFIGNDVKMQEKTRKMNSKKPILISEMG